METENDVERDWSSLPPEVLNLIAKKLYEIIDFIRFRAVCITWRFSTATTDLPPQFPLMQEDRFSKEPELRFFSVPYNIIYTVHVAKAMNKILDEPCDGYYLARMYDNNNYLSHLSLINPLNNDEILLPACDYGIPLWFGHGVNKTEEYVVICAFLCEDSEIKFVFCRVGQEYWCELKLDCDFMRCSHFFHKGILFTVDNETGVTKLTDITCGTLIYVVPPIKDYLTWKQSNNFQVVQVSGDILGVFVCRDPSSEFSNDVYHLDLNNSQPYWVKVKNIGDYAIFMDSARCCFILKANDLAGIKANCIYVLKKIYARLYGEYLREVEMIDIETGAREHVRCPFKKAMKWFVPNLHHRYTR